MRFFTAILVLSLVAVALGASNGHHKKSKALKGHARAARPEKSLKASKVVKDVKSKVSKETRADIRFTDLLPQAETDIGKRCTLFYELLGQLTGSLFYLYWRIDDENERTSKSAARDVFAEAVKLRAALTKLDEVPMNDRRPIDAQIKKIYDAMANIIDDIEEGSPDFTDLESDYDTAEDALEVIIGSEMLSLFDDVDYDIPSNPTDDVLIESLIDIDEYYSELCCEKCGPGEGIEFGGLMVKVVRKCRQHRLIQMVFFVYGFFSSPGQNGRSNTWERIAESDINGDLENKSLIYCANDPRVKGLVEGLLALLVDILKAAGLEDLLEKLLGLDEGSIGNLLGDIGSILDKFVCDLLRGLGLLDLLGLGNLLGCPPN